MSYVVNYVIKINIIVCLIIVLKQSVFTLQEVIKWRGELDGTDADEDKED